MLGLRKPNFKTKIIRSEKSHNAENCKRGVRGHFEIFLTSILLQNRKKIEEGPFGDIKKNCEEKFHKAEIPCTKNFGQGRDSNPRSSAWQTSKNPN